MFSIDNFIDSKNRNLYVEVSEKTNIIFIENYKWESQTYDDLAIIYYVESDDAISCFTHELLHVKYYHLGLKYPSHTAEKNFNKFIASLFNQLSHHKFFEEFIQLGFEPLLFLSQDMEKKTIIEIEQKIIELENQHKLAEEINLFDLISTYLSLKSPHDTGENVMNSKIRLKAIGNEYLFSTIDSILDDWKHGETLDSSLSIARLLKVYNFLDIGIYNNKGEVILARDV